MIRAVLGMAVFSAAAFTAAQLDSLSQFLGAALGAFAARYASRNFDKKTVSDAVEEGISKHEIACPLRKTNHV